MYLWFLNENMMYNVSFMKPCYLLWLLQAHCKYWKNKYPLHADWCWIVSILVDMWLYCMVTVYTWWGDTLFLFCSYLKATLMTAAMLYPFLQTCPLPYSQLVTVALKDRGRRVAMSKCMRVGWVSLQLNDSSCFIRSDIVPTRTAPRTKVTDFFTHLDARRSARATGPQENVAIYNGLFWDTFSTRMI